MLKQTYLRISSSVTSLLDARVQSIESVADSNKPSFLLLDKSDAADLVETLSFSGEELVLHFFKKRSISEACFSKLRFFFNSASAFSRRL